MPTVKALVNRWNVKIDSTMVDQNPNAPDWHDANHYKCKLTTHNPRRSLTIYFSQGYGISRDPEASDVLSCLASDASSVRFSRGFEDWCSDLGYDTDSRKAERTFKACEAQAEKLERFLGSERFEELLQAEGD